MQVRRSIARPTNPVHYVDTYRGLQRLSARLARQPLVALDVETTLYDQRLCLVQLGIPDATWLVDAVIIKDVSALSQVMEDGRVVKVIHNASFERRVLAQHGIDILNVFDTLAMSRKIRGRPAQGGHGLAAVCQRELGIYLDKSEQTSDWMRRPLSKSQLEYAALDAEVLVKLHRVFQQALPAQLF